MPARALGRRLAGGGSVSVVRLCLCGVSQTPSVCAAPIANADAPDFAPVGPRATTSAVGGSNAGKFKRWKSSRFTGERRCPLSLSPILTRTTRMPRSEALPAAFASQILRALPAHSPARTRFSSDGRAVHVVLLWHALRSSTMRPRSSCALRGSPSRSDRRSCRRRPAPLPHRNPAALRHRRPSAAVA